VCFFLLEYEPGRTMGTTFEMCNLGKSSVVLDCKKASGRKEFLKLLKGADVLITNVRCDALKRLKLDYESVRLEMPHLVYCSLTAYGSEGPDANAPGYDVGAFWAATGMAASIQPQPLHGVYPAAFGDTTTGSALVGGAACALRRRCLTGQGCLVDASLLGAGLFCLSATVCQQVPDRRPTTEAAVTAVAASAGAGGLGSSSSPSSSCVAEEPDVSRHFACKDGAVAVLGPRLTHAPPRQHGGGSRDGRGGSGDGVGGPSVADLERALKINHNSARGTESPLSSLSHAFATLTVASAVDLLTAANVPCCRASELLHFKDFVSDHGDELFHPTADCVPEFEADVALLPRKPFVFLKQGTEEEHGHDTSGNNNTDGNNKSVWCEEGQRPRASAPALGAHTKDVLKNGWQPRHPSCVFPTQPREAAALLANASSTSTSTSTTTVAAAAAAAADAASSRLGLLLLPSATRPLEGLVVVELSWCV
jgi:crotonobetainyl-CoA:carnitine CoA-transferase CaiB-like acyl-CoA transferase